jgi:hypothetical protein
MNYYVVKVPLNRNVQSMLGTLSPSTAEVKKFGAIVPLVPHVFKAYTGQLYIFPLRLSALRIKIFWISLGVY